MTRSTIAVAVALILTCSGLALAQTTIETDGEVKAQGFDGDGSKLTNVDASTFGGEASGFFATAAELLAAIEVLDNPDGPCFDATRRFVDCGNGTVTDTVTGLIWLYDAGCLGQLDWVTANESAAALADGTCGLTDGSRAGDWRLPTEEEWSEIVDFSCDPGPDIVGNQTTGGCYIDADDEDSEWASGVVASYYYSSTTVSTNAESARAVELFVGAFASGPKTFANYVWPVRGGQ
jgi:hypothetical protein